MDERTMGTRVNRRQVLGGMVAGVVATQVAAKRSTLAMPHVQKTTTIEYWHPPHGADPDAEKAWLETQIREFETANAGIKVNLTIVPWADAYLKWTTAIAAGAPPDVSISGSEAAVQFAAEGHLLPVTDLVAADRDYFGMLPYFSFQDEYWQVPYIAGSWVLYYNPAMLSALGVDGPPATWDQVLEVAQAATKGDVYGFPLSFAKNYNCGQAYMCMQSAWGVGSLTPEGKVNMTDPKMAELTSFYVSFLTEHKVTPPDALSWTGSSEPLAYFQNGKAPMVAAYGNQASAVLAAAQPNGVKVEIANMPKGPAGRPGSYGATNGHMIFTKAKNPEAARLFIRFLHEDARLVEWSKTTGWVAPTRQAAESPDLTGPGLVAMRDQLSAGAVVRNGYAYGGHPANGEVEGKLLFPEMLQEIAVAGRSVDDALKEYQSKLEALYA